MKFDVYFKKVVEADDLEKAEAIARGAVILGQVTEVVFWDIEECNGYDEQEEELVTA
jgi:hypothetical protein